MKQTKKQGLSTIEWLVYNYLKERTSNGLWTTQKDLQLYLESKGYHRELRNIRDYVYNIRHCEIIQKVILSNSNGYRIMSSEEEFEMIEAKKISALKKLKQVYDDIKRVKANGQLRFKLTSSERDVIESFLKM